MSHSRQRKEDESEKLLLHRKPDRFVLNMANARYKALCPNLT